MDRSGERFFWQSLDSKTQRRIISAANKNTLCRVLVIAYLAGFLFYCHIRRYLLTDPKRKIACILSSVLLFFYVTANQAALVVKGEMPQLDVDVIVTEPEADIVEGYAERPVYQVQITNSGMDVLNNIMLQSQTADVFLLYQEVEVPVYHPQEENPDEANVGQTETANNTSGQEQMSDSEPLLTELPTVLEPGQSLTYMIYMPFALSAGEYIELLSFYADELDSPVEILLCMKVLEDSSEHDSDNENTGGETDSEKQEGETQDSEGTESTEIETQEPETDSLESAVGSEETETDSQEPAVGSSESETDSEKTEIQKPETSSEASETESQEPATDSEASETESQEPATDSPESETGSQEMTADLGGSEQNSLKPEPDSEKITIEEETNSGEVEGVEAEKPQDNILLPAVEVTAREGGYYMGNTFFVTTASNFEVKATNAHVLPNGSIVYGSPIKAVFCEINGTIQELELRDGRAAAALPEAYHGVIKFYAVDELGSYSNTITEYVISEKNAPTVDYAKVVSATDGSEQIRVTLKDSGEIISGISETECYIDGEQYTEYKTEVFEKQMLSGGMEVSSGVFFDIPLRDHEVHTIEVVVTDYTGNSFVKVFRVCATQSDVVSVVLPTRFGMEIFPTAANGNIFGEDIVIANQSDFPVEVTLAAANVGIDHELPENRILTSELAVGNDFEQPFDLTKLQNTVEKDAALNLNLKKVDGDESVFALQEGTNSDVVRFTLQPKNPDTDAALLQREQSGEPVNSGDYAIVNIRGMISEGSERMWKDGDITVSLTFTFRKSEENE